MFDAEGKQNFGGRIAVCLLAIVIGTLTMSTDCSIVDIRTSRHRILNYFRNDMLQSTGHQRKKLQGKPFVLRCDALSNGFFFRFTADPIRWRGEYVFLCNRWCCCWRCCWLRGGLSCCVVSVHGDDGRNRLQKVHRQSQTQTGPGRKLTTMGDPVGVPCVVLLLSTSLPTVHILRTTKYFLVFFHIFFLSKKSKKESYKKKEGEFP